MTNNKKQSVTQQVKEAILYERQINFEHEQAEYNMISLFGGN
jgi:hypothetical protein